MTDREKLIELLVQACRERYPCSENYCKEYRYYCKAALADHLLANGVTFAKDTDIPSKWISVEDALPGTQKILITDGDIVMRGYRRPDGVWKYGVGAHETWDRLSLRPVTHWMPLPEAPKEE